MNDLNLIPQQIKIEEELRIKRRLYITLAVSISLVIILITLIPVYLIYRSSNENKLTEAEIKKLDYITEEVNKFNAQKKNVQDRTKVVDSVLKQDKKWTGIIDDISTLMPSFITLNSINCSGENISLQCMAKSRDDIAIFIGKLENSDKFINVKTNEIKNDEKTQKYLFDLQMKLKTTESKVK